MLINSSQISAFEKRYRTNLINALSGFKSVNLIGTVNKKGQTNLAIFSSVVHLGAEPALIGFIQRPASVERHTYENITETGYFTINHVHEGIYRAAHQTSARYAREQSEFDETGLTPEYLNNFSAPFVKESLIKIGCSFKGEIPIPFNNTILIAGAIEQIVLDDELLMQDGHLNLQAAHTVAVSGLDHYYRAEELERLPYAKPGRRV
ncbi:MAG: flavin reductase [Bacteroidia bacterium]